MKNALGSFHLAQDLVSPMSQILFNQSPNSVSFFFESPHSLEKATLLRLADSRFRVGFSSLFLVGRTIFDVEINSQPSGRISLARSFLTDDLCVQCSLGSPFLPIDPKARFNAPLWAKALYTSGPSDLSLFLGGSPSHSLVINTTLNSPIANTSLGCLIGHRSNVLDGAYLSATGWSASGRIDFYTGTLLRLQFGRLLSVSSVSSFLAMNLLKRSLKVAAVYRFNNRIQLAYRSHFSLQRTAIDFGIKVEAAGDFSMKVSVDGKSELMTRFRPIEWLEVTLKSATSFRTNFDPLTLEWSLRFILPEDILHRTK
jgi:hypothetical protein